MPYIIILLTIFLMYVSFETNNLDTLINDDEDGLSGMLSDESDFETMSVLGDLSGNDESDRDYDDVDISNYL